ncbi:MAG: S8 family serine peptidase [Roseburia sp.]|nr:S8 family serine peptidase [Roseburia sp.]
MDFEDDEVWVILKSAYDYLTEIKFSDLKIVEEVSRIDYIRYELKEYTYEDGAVPFKKGDKHQQFKIVLEEHSKEKVLAVCKLLQTLDIVLVAEPDYIYDIAYDWQPSDTGYLMQWGLNGTYGINAEQAWGITRGSTNVKVGVMESNIDSEHEDLKGSIVPGNLTPSGNTTNAAHGTHVAGIIGAVQNDYGVAALIYSKYSYLSGSDIKATILNNVNQVPALNGYCVTGGILNAYRFEFDIQRRKITLSHRAGLL